MKLIVAVNQDWGIGLAGDLLTRIPDDLAHFAELTSGKVVILGALTLATFPGGRPLKNRINIILNDDVTAKVPGAMVCNCLPEVLALAGTCISDEVFVIGGASVYEQLLPYCSQAHITKLAFDSPRHSDRFFPNLDEMDDWTLSESSEPKRYEDVEYRFEVYTNAATKEIG